MDGTAQLRVETPEHAAAQTAHKPAQVQGGPQTAGPVHLDSGTPRSDSPARHRVVDAMHQVEHMDIGEDSAAHSAPWMRARPPVHDYTVQEWMPPGWSVAYDAEAWARDERIIEWLKQQDFSELQLEVDDAGGTCSGGDSYAAAAPLGGSTCKEGKTRSVGEWLRLCEGRMYAIVEDALSDRRFFATASADERGLNVMRGRRAGVRNRKLSRGGARCSMDPCLNELLPGEAVPSACLAVETPC